MPSNAPESSRNNGPCDSSDFSGLTRSEEQPFWLQRLHEIVLRLLEIEESEPVAAAKEPTEVPPEIDISLQPQGQSSSRVLDDLEIIARLTPKTATRRFFNQLFAGRDGMGTAAEMLVAVLNSAMYTHKVAGINANIEDEVIKKLLKLVGFDRGDGTFFPGGSVSNLTSLILARDHARAKRRSESPVPLEQFTLYASDCCHYSVAKNAKLAGIPRRNVRKVAVDAQGKIVPSELVAAIKKDQDAGLIPCMINATSGTTVMGSFDPLPALADIAEESGIWLHVDAALGGGVLFSKKHRHLLDGCDRADSFSWSAHKTMGVPLSCSVLLTRHKDALEDCFEAEADYLFQADDQSMDFGIKSMQCGRRNDALKLWAVWRHRGHRGMGERIDRLFALAGITAEKVAAVPGLELAVEPESTNVCIRTQHATPEEICRRLAEDRTIIVGHALVHNEPTIRIPLVNPEVTEQDIDFLLSAIARIDAAAAG